MRHVLAGGILLFAIAGCASNPDVTVQYYHAKTVIDITATQTVGCSENNDIYIATSVKVVPMHMADFSQGPATLNLSDLGGWWADADIGFDFYEDGRLKSLNAVTTGKGDEIIDSAISLASALGFGSGAAKRDDAESICDAINGGKPSRDKTANLNYRLRHSFAEGDRDIQGIEVPPTEASRALHEKLSSEIGSVRAKVEAVEKPEPVINARPDNDHEYVNLVLKQPAIYSIVVTTGGRGATIGEQIVWQGDVQLAQRGVSYAVPLPASALFGQRTAKLTLAESGALTSLTYSSTNGVSSAMDSAAAMAGIVEGASAAERAAEVKAEADLIVQQQRLIRCQADEANCT